MFDTDALAQIFIAGQQETLGLLKKEFGVSFYMMSEVDTEIRSNRKISGLVTPRLDKALRNGYIKVLTAGDLERIARPLDGSVQISLQDIRTLGQEYAAIVGIGEAYTHAAAVLLKTPSVSNDMRAVRTLEANKKALPPTILRSFDLFGFLYAEKFLVKKDVEDARSALLARSEWIPACMKHKSFEEGFKELDCRLSSSLTLAASGQKWSDPFSLQRVEVKPSS